MFSIAEGVSFDTIAREWRCKWSLEGDKASLVAAQKALESIVADVKKVPGVKRVDRIVCGGCLDFKIVTLLAPEDFEKWQASNFEPEAEFLEKLKAIDGISMIETQNYTIMSI
eukprot:CAMPEP_0172422266 /NCGR_PEP_ID=MMETSP1064-20121228/8435_1 /TAXON_ID=202472 /ORGANISM="Aulacoseira subarctica , Strain CCAP 1002/5" /LENGTH=112 /DNA_ID=CAMNT_0013163051 /DNA_START=133 /DNA_END=471 /DNA_ORIENTATION=+